MTEDMNEVRKMLEDVFQAQPGEVRGEPGEMQREDEWRVDPDQGKAASEAVSGGRAFPTPPRMPKPGSDVERFL